MMVEELNQSHVIWMCVPKSSTASSDFSQGLKTQLSISIRSLIKLN